jgi:hypothetical protein
LNINSSLRSVKLLNQLICGDALEVMKTIPGNATDSIVTDPPAGISFMGKEWDDDKGGSDNWIQWLSEVMTEAKRVLKPGGHSLVWALPRTSHWTGFALEKAGFEVRDCVYHVFGSGFPKSLDISKAIDKQAGAERKTIGKSVRGSGAQPNKLNNHGRGDTGIGYADGSGKEFNITAPATPEAKQWEGWGTALKPAVECWWLVRKPLSEKTVAENVLRWGVGGLNINGCRVAGPLPHHNYGRTSGKRSFVGKGNASITPTQGRFPSHLIHDGSDEVLAEFPTTTSGKPQGFRNTGGGYSRGFGRVPVTGFGDTGTAARFFYCAKPSKRERDAGLEGMENKTFVRYMSEKLTKERTDTLTSHKNNHPTVKAQALMRYLIKLITPPKGIILDPFAGSGSTLVAAKSMGHGFIGIEISPEYCTIAKKRLR